MRKLVFSILAFFIALNIYAVAPEGTVGDRTTPDNMKVTGTLEEILEVGFTQSEVFDIVTGFTKISPVEEETYGSITLGDTLYAAYRTNHNGKIGLALYGTGLSLEGGAETVPLIVSVGEDPGKSFSGRFDEYVVPSDNTSIPDDAIRFADSDAGKGLRGDTFEVSLTSEELKEATAGRYNAYLTLYITEGGN